MTLSDQAVVLMLGGGNALGAYQAGGYQALHERGLRPNWVIGTSTGAINGAIIAGNEEDDRLARLADYWGLGAPPAGEEPTSWGDSFIEDLRRSLAASASMAMGNPNVFAPRLQPSLFWPQFNYLRLTSLYDSRPLSATLERLVDFDRLNAGAVRFSATAVDLENGEVVTFDSKRATVVADHVRASSALLPAFQPIEIEGRLLGDGGLAINLPVDVVLADPPTRPTLCIALDLLPLTAPRPTTLGESASRMQDLMFASQSRRSIAAWQALYDARGDADTAVTLLHLSYDRQEAEVAGKAFDYSPHSVSQRWRAGYQDVTDALDRIEDSSIALSQRGLYVWRNPKAAA